MRKTLVITMLAVLAGNMALAQSRKSKPASSATTAQSHATVAAKQDLVTKETLEAYFKRMFGYDTNLAFTVAKTEPANIEGMTDATVVVASPQGQQVTHWYVSSDQHWVITGESFSFGADPFAANRELLKQRAFGATAGSPDASFQIVEFADLECPACSKAAPLVQHLQQDFPKVKFVFQSFPLEKIHPWAMTAAKYLDCIQRVDNAQALTFIEAVFSHQQEIDQGVRNTTGGIDEMAVAERMKHYAQLAKTDPDKTAACVALPETEARVRKSIAIGTDLHVPGTPTLFVNGRQLMQFSNVPYENLKALVEFEINQAGASK